MSTHIPGISPDAEEMTMEQALYERAVSAERERDEARAERDRLAELVNADGFRESEERGALIDMVARLQLALKHDISRLAPTDQDVQRLDAQVERLEHERDAWMGALREACGPAWPGVAMCVLTIIHGSPSKAQDVFALMPRTCPQEDSQS